MRKFAFLAALAAVIMSGCSQSDDVVMDTTEANAISFRPVVEKSRASLVDGTGELTSFFVHAEKDGDDNFSFLEASVYTNDGGTTWTYAPKKYYPVDGTTAVNFYAYAPVKDKNMTTAMAISSGTVTFGYTVPADQSISNTAVDLLVASETGKTSGDVAFTFNHALSAVTFSAANLNPATSELVYTISEIAITDMDNVGTYTYGTPGTWIMSGTTTTYTAGVPASGVAVVPGGNAATAVNLLSKNDVMMVLPQTPANTAKVEITYSLKDGGGADIYADATLELLLPSGFEFEAGKRYNFAFSFAPSNAIVLTVTEVTGWVPVTESLN